MTATRVWFGRWRCFLTAGLMICTLGCGAHTLPVSYLRLAPEADYLHLELVFNPFELSFMSELDDNRDGELNPTELAAHGDVLANRVVGGIKLSVGGRVLFAETTGMDPDLSGHHVRLRAHYKVDARRLALTVESELATLTSASHLTQVTYASRPQAQLAQLDPQSRKVTFEPSSGVPAATARPDDPPRRAAQGLVLLLTVALLVGIGAVVLWIVRRRLLE